MKGHDLRLLPVAALAWFGAWVGVSGWRPEPSALLALGVGVGLLAVVAFRAHRGWVGMCLIVLLLTALAAGALSWQRHGSPVAELARGGAVAIAEFRVTGEPQARTAVVVVRAELVQVESRGTRVEASVPVVVLASGTVAEEALELSLGATYRARVRLGGTEMHEPEAAVLSLRQVQGEVSPPGALDALAGGLRQGLRDAVAHSPPEQAALVPSLVVGDTSAVDDETREQFRATGLTHLMAVSGANLTLMLGVVLAAVRAAGLRGWPVRIAAVVGVAGFVLVCGHEPSVLRAAVMGLVALAATWVGRGGRSVRGLCVAVSVLVWLDPWLSRSVGFALSVAACAGIVALGPMLIGSLTRWAPRWVAEALAVPLAAQLATQPLVTAISSQVSVVGVLTNVAAGPFVGPTTVLGLAAALLSFAPALAAGPGWLAGWCAQPIIWLAQAGAALPSAAWRWEATVLGVGLVALGCTASAVLLVWGLRYRLGGLMFVVLLTCACLIRAYPLGWPGAWSVVFCDVGQGDATAVRAGPAAVVLVDAGPEPGPTIACLESLGVREVPLLVLTHYHADHVGGAQSVVEKFRPLLILVREGAPPQWLGEAAARVGAEVREAVAGERIALGEAAWHTFAVGQPPGVVEEEVEGAGENDASVAGTVTSGGLRVLLPGDLEPPGQARALRSAARVGASLEVHVLKIPHHGSARQEPRFFAATGATVAVVSAGAGNDYGHPAEAALRLSVEHSMTVLRTDEQGSIGVSLGERELVVRTER